MPHPLEILEAHTLRTARQCAALLGVAYSSYMAMRAGKSPIPRYVALHADLLTRIPGDLLLVIERERLPNG